MKFRRKLFLYKCIENLPFGMDIYHFAQEKVTKSLLLPDEDFMSRFDDKVLRHEIAIKRYGMTEQKKSVFFEFGAGWDMLAPIGFSLVGGVKRYIAVDLNKHLRKSIIQNTMELYRSNIDKIERVTGNSVRLDKNINCYPDIRQNAGSWLKDNLAIEYLAPCDAGTYPQKEYRKNFKGVYAPVAEGRVNFGYCRLFRPLEPLRSFYNRI